MFTLSAFALSRGQQQQRRLLDIFVLTSVLVFVGAQSVLAIGVVGCPATEPFLDSHGGPINCVCVTSNGPQCFSLADGVSCPNDKLYLFNASPAAAAKNNAAGICVGSSSGDPLVKGFDGCTWYMKGQPDQVLNMITESNHSLNTQLVAANLDDEDHPDNGTFHGALSIRYGQQVVSANVTPQGNLTVFIGDTIVPFEESRESSGLTVKVFEFLPFYGQAAEVTTPFFDFFIHAVQPYDTPAGWSRGHLDFVTTIKSPNLEMHGLLGQSMRYKHDTCPVDWSFQGDGAEADYLLEDLSKVDYKYSLFGQQNIHTSRRLHSIDAECMDANFKPLSAYSSGFN